MQCSQQQSKWTVRCTAKIPFHYLPQLASDLLPEFLHSDMESDG